LSNNPFLFIDYEKISIEVDKFSKSLFYIVKSSKIDMSKIQNNYVAMPMKRTILYLFFTFLISWGLMLLKCLAEQKQIHRTYAIII